jgi:acyl carrier protein
MTADELKSRIFELLGRIAPEADLSALDPSVNIRTELDLDSMDFLNFLISLSKELQVEVPERDYGQLSTLKGCLEYLLPRVAGTPKSAAAR